MVPPPSSTAPLRRLRDACGLSRISACTLGNAACLPKPDASLAKMRPARSSSEAASESNKWM
eukprot:7465916-Pyramimonas_sp.AAC.1